MKKFIYLFVLPLFLTFSCVTQEEKPLTDSDKETLKSEVSSRIDEVVTIANKMDAEAIKGLYWDNPAFIAVSLGNTFNYQDYMNDTEETWSNMETINFQETNTEISILDKNTAYAVFSGLAKGTTKSGQDMEFEDFNVTMLFRKAGGVWKIAGTHESGNPVMVDMEDDMTE